MGKKITVDKSESDRSPEDVEAGDSLESAGVAVAEIAESSGDTGVNAKAGGIDIAKIIKSTGGVQSAVNSAVPMIDQIASMAKSEAQRASALAMKEYRRQLQRIMLSMQGTIREEGVHIADEICARVTTQIRQAVLLETEKKALNLVDEFILGWQIEAESMSQELLTSDEESDTETSTAEVGVERIPKAVTPVPAKDDVTVSDKATKPVDAGQKDKAVPVIETQVAVDEKAASPVSSPKKQAETTASDRLQTENEKKVVFDFATFIAQSKSPVKS